MSSPVAELGFDEDVPQPLPMPSDVSAAGLRAEDWFLLSRIDGRTSLRDLFRLSPSNWDDTVAGLRRLLVARLVSLPNAKLVEPAKPVEPEPTSPNWSVPIDQYPFDKQLLDAASDLPMSLRRELLYYHEHLQRVTYYSLLQLERTANNSAIKRAYYPLTKRFHPDRWFRRPLGPLEQPLREVFAWLSKAYRTLIDSQRRAEYDALLSRGILGPWQQDDKSGHPTRVDKSGMHDLGLKALLARGRKFVSGGQYLHGADCFRRVLKLQDDPGLALELADALVKANADLDEAVLLVRAVRRKQPTNYAAQLLEVRILKLRGEYRAARQICEGILRAQPGHAGARAELKGLEDV